VYLGSMTQVLQTAVQFLLQKDKAANEAALLEVQVRNAEAQILLVGAQTELAIQQKKNAENEWLLLAEQKAKLIAETAMIVQQKANAIIDGELTAEQKTKTVAETRVLGQAYLNAVTENATMLKQQCKLAAEFDVLMEQKLKTAQETTLLSQKTATEKAQTVAAGVDDASVVGRQKKLYEAQTNGFTRNSEQSAAKLLIDSWTVRRTTDEGTVADSVNNLNDATIGRAVNKLLSGINA
jgi:hypothetical protein